MSTFPPKKGNNPNPPNPPQVTGERGPISVGNGGIPASLRIKAAGTKNAPGLEKTNSAS